jgi:dienelactone hydrolase
VVCVNGGQASEVPGTWSASIEWLVARLAQRFTDVRFVEVRYRVKSWKRLDWCVEDARAAIDAAGADRVLFVEVRYRVKTWNALDSCRADAHAALDLVARPSLLVGFSMGGAVSVRAAAHPAVTGVLGLAPWLPDQLDLTPLDGRRLDVVHGALDRWLPGIPGVSPSISRRGFERARALGVDGTYTLIPGALHGIALRGRGGRLVPLPRAGRWIELAASRVADVRG